MRQVHGWCEHEAGCLPCSQAACHGAALPCPAAVLQPYPQQRSNRRPLAGCHAGGAAAACWASMPHMEWCSACNNSWPLQHSAPCHGARCVSCMGSWRSWGQLGACCGCCGKATGQHCCQQQGGASQPERRAVADSVIRLAGTSIEKHTACMCVSMLQERAGSAELFAALENGAGKQVENLGSVLFGTLPRFQACNTLLVLLLASAGGSGAGMAD